MNEPVRCTTLPNGVRVLSQHIHGVRSVSVGAIVDVGSKDETPEERGYAHLVEHMLFQGTDERDARAIAEMMEVGGGAIGAFTARDYTVFHATVLDEYLPFALEVLGDMLCNSVIPEEALDRQREVILNEIAGYDDPLKTANDLVKTALWPEHPLSYPTAGLESTIRAVNRESLLDFMRRHYVGSRLILAASGNLEDSDFAAQALDSVWQMQRGNDPIPASPPAPQIGCVVAEPRDIQQVYFTMAWPAPAYTSPDRYAAHVFTALFGGGPNSRLYRQLREAQGMVYHVEAQYHAYSSTGALVVEGAALPRMLVPVLAGVLIEMLKLGEDEISLDDHYRVVQSLISQHLVSGDSAYVRMSRLGLQELYFARPVPTDEVTTGLRGSEPTAISEIAQRTFASGLPTIALVGPVSEALLQAVGAMLADFGEPVSLMLRPRSVARGAAETIPANQGKSLDASSLNRYANALLRVNV